MKKRETSGEEGFTLLEILTAMIILAVGGVSVLSLFAAAVSLQYKSYVSTQEAEILPEIVAEAQQVLNRHVPTADEKVPKPIPKKAAGNDGSFEVEVTFTEVSGDGMLMPTPPGEGVVAVIRFYHENKERGLVRTVLQKTVFSEAEIRKNVTYEQDKVRDRQAEQERDPEEDRSGPPR